MSDLVIDLSGIDPLPEAGATAAPADRRTDRAQRTAGFGSVGRTADEFVPAHTIAASSWSASSARRRAGLSMVMLSLLARARERVLIDRHGRQRRPSWTTFLAEEAPFALERERLSRRVSREALARSRRLRPAGAPKTMRPSRVAFIRPDLGPALTAGGSLAHIHGVLRGLEQHGCAVTLLSPAPLSGVRDDSGQFHLIAEDERFRVSVELPHLAYNATLIRRGTEILSDWRPDVIYQRHALGCYAGATVAQALDVPLVVEYNGPEVWIGRYWGSLTRHGELFEEIETPHALCSGSDRCRFAAVGRAPRSGGVEPERVLVNPNGVEVERFDPDARREDRERLRSKLGIDSGTVLAGFVGTFGPWHGAEVLAAAIGRLPETILEKTRFVFVGDGPRRSVTESIVERSGRRDHASFTGAVGFDEIPAWLAAFDLCLSPHVPNVDGSPFFGSPTKLFEYLASGRAVIASELGQLGELLEHERTAWLVPPGDAGALARAITTLAGRPELRAALGRAGRECVLRDHTWTAHVDRILERLATPAARTRSGGEARP